jgi:hypothetical protein
MGKAPAGGGSSPVGLDFVFEITNPNSFPVKYESSSFFLFFEDYELRVVNDSNAMWIPPGKTNSKVLNVTLTPFSTYAKFLLASKELAAKRGDQPWQKIEEWWNKLPDMSFRIDLKDGNFTFSADGGQGRPVTMKCPRVLPSWLADRLLKAPFASTSEVAVAVNLQRNVSGFLSVMREPIYVGHSR